MLPIKIKMRYIGNTALETIVTYVTYVTDKKIKLTNTYARTHMRTHVRDFWNPFSILSVTLGNTYLWRLTGNKVSVTFTAKDR